MFTVDSIAIKYDKKYVIEDLSFKLKEGEIMSIIGPNGSGKSTVLKAISGQIPYSKGSVRFDGEDLRTLKQREIAKKLCILSQKNQAPSDMTVEELVTYGRYPHKRWFDKLNKEDMELVEWALEKTKMTTFKNRSVHSLSGGEGQRAWIAMALAQRPKVLLLDEPTTYLDISHQHEVLELVRELNQEMNMTVLMVLHDLNQASYYSDRVVVVQSGEKERQGTPREIFTCDMIKCVYRMDCEIDECAQGKPRIHLLNTTK